MNLNQLLYFTQLAELEHMTKTAEKLKISQPSLSYQISELEKELAAPLFEKTGRNIRLSPYGKTYYNYAKQALNVLEQGKQAIEDTINQINGSITIGFIYTMGTFVVPYLAKTFNQDHPEINFFSNRAIPNNYLTSYILEILILLLCQRLIARKIFFFTKSMKRN